jgi:hypothetical protein
MYSIRFMFRYPSLIELTWEYWSTSGLSGCHHCVTPNKKTLSVICAKCFFVLAPRAGLEPATRWLTVTCSTNWATADQCGGVPVQSGLYQKHSCLQSVLDGEIIREMHRGRVDILTRPRLGAWKGVWDDLIMQPLRGGSRRYGSIGQPNCGDVSIYLGEELVGPGG